MKHKVALLSNVNISFVTRMLGKDLEMYAGEGYGNELGLMMDKNSSYHAFEPQITFLIIDLLEAIKHETDAVGAEEVVARWFRMLETCLQPGKIYYVSDAFLWGTEAELLSPQQRRDLESIWMRALEKCVGAHSNVRVFPYCSVIERLGTDNAFSLKMWYMGKIMHTGDAQKRLAEEILHKCELETGVPKKVLVLDLDNTLWGGLAGEADITPVTLSDDHGGLAYKNLQRVILQMQKAGVILAIASKNNEADASEIIDKHPHMVLRSDAFAAKRINWNNKADNIAEMAQELNLGLDSFVFFDDSDTERELIKKLLPQVVVPDFPAKPEELAPAMCEIYRKYFEKPVLTKEDAEKTRQYAENAKRSQLQASAFSFADYLKDLQIKLESVKPVANLDRFIQLMNKTNQFNLTTKRYDLAEMQKVLEDSIKKVYLYRVEDCFGDYGIVAALIVDLSGVPTITDFVMSCRIMGKNVEYGILTIVEEELRKLGYGKVQGLYCATPKNKPVEKLYEKAGYMFVGRQAAADLYELDLATNPEREYYMKTIQNHVDL
ncbi:MAG: HAD-IIIC family phosphatase [Lachnospiraceae bacterium]|nr:HAD-IIIC family phosphatase [Lachnospiraceae bacterium]